MAQTFVHLHIHSEYSLSDGSIRIDKLIEQTKKFGHKHVALTDHNNLHGAVDFYLKAKEADITPIIGCEILIPGISSHQQDKANQLVILAKNTSGYKKLLKIVSSGYLGKDSTNAPIVPLSALKSYKGDLVAISPFSGGEFSNLLLDNLNKKNSDLEQYTNLMLEIFADNLFIEICDNKLPGNKKRIVDIAKTAKSMNLPLVATANAHYLDKDLLESHTIAVAVKNGLSLKTIRQRLRDVEFHLTSSEEMQTRFADYPEALENTIKIAQACSDVHIDMGKFHLPKISDKNESVELTLRRLAKEGLEKRFKIFTSRYGESFDKIKQDEYYKRLEYELNVIVKMGFPDYFLIVQDFIAWAKRKKIPVGPGRGSGAGSLVAYSLEITDIDPIPYNLIFERFLNPERVSMPDFDIDFCQWRREEVINYCIERYGKTNVAQITTFGRLNAKGVVKAVGRAMNLSFGRVDRFTKLFPNDLGITLKQCLTQEPRLKEELQKDDELNECMSEAIKLEGLCSHTSVHAAGVVISDGQMDNYVPIYTTDGSSYITQYEMKPTEKVGLVKFDFLGLKTLTVIDNAVRMIREQENDSFNVSDIPIDDQKVFKSIEAGNTCGVFQCESSGMQNLIAKLRPSTFEDIVALVALFRPGPLGSGMVDDFVMRKHGKQKITFSLPELEPILKDTYGMILYQEQVQKIAAVLANYSLGEADLLRRAMGKKIPEEMAKQKTRFLSGAEKNKIDKNKAEDIFDLMAEFAKYGFNKSHSAAYGLISYQTAYIKAYYPEYYLAACMTCDMDNTDKIVRYIEECKRLNIKVETPHINSSKLIFTVPKPKVINFALCAIKGLGEGPLKPLIECRENDGIFSSVTDVATRINLSKFGKKNLQLAIYSGALDNLEYTRETLDKMTNHLVSYSTELFEAKQTGKRSLFDLENDSKPNKKSLWLDEKSFQKINDQERCWSLRDLFAEMKLLGTFLTSHPLDFFKKDQKAFETARFNNLKNLLNSEGNRHKISIIAIMTKIEMRRTKKGSLLAYIRLEQSDSFHEAIMFSSALERTNLPPINSLVLAEGTIDKFSDDAPIRFNVDRIRLAEEVRKESLSGIKLHLDISSKNSIKEFATIENIFKKCPGKLKTTAYINHEDCKINLGKLENIQINPNNELIQKLSVLSSLNITYDLQKAQA